MNWNKLTDEERIVAEWQYDRLGSFKQTIMKAISLADEDNLARLEDGFPIEVAGFLKFKTIPGWWQNVENKLEGKT